MQPHPRPLSCEGGAAPRTYQLCPDPVVELVGPDTITGEGAARIWSEITRRPVTYVGDEIGLPFERQTAETMPAWQAHDLVAMFRGCQREGMQGKPGAVNRLEKLLGQPLRTYYAFAQETYQQWESRC